MCKKLFGSVVQQGLHHFIFHNALQQRIYRYMERICYPAVMGMFGVGPTLGPQLIAEIGDVRRFYSKKALVAYAGLDAPPNDSGDVTGKHKSMSKIGASSLRRTLFLVMSVYLQNAPLDEPIYQFMDRKRAEGKPYRVYMMASANKFLRIYYATVKAYLESLEQV